MLGQRWNKVYGSIQAVTDLFDLRPTPQDGTHTQNYLSYHAPDTR